MVFREDFEMDLPSRRGGVSVRDGAQIARHDTEEIRRLGERIGPNRIMPSILGLAFANFVAVGKKNRVGALICFDTDTLKYSHVVWPIGVCCVVQIKQTKK